MIAVGTLLWFVAWGFLMAFHDTLDDHGNEWWIWTAVAGLGLGAWGWLLVRKRTEARTAPRPARTAPRAARNDDPRAARPVPRRRGRRRRAADKAP